MNLTLYRLGDSDDSPRAYGRELQLAVGQRYYVYPVESDRAYEEFAEDKPQGEIKRLIHYIFAWQCPVGEDADSRLFSAIRDTLLHAWEPGAVVMWRHRPEFSTEEDIAMRRVYCRLGSFSPPKSMCKKEGDLFPTLAEIPA